MRIRWLRHHVSLVLVFVIVVGCAGDNAIEEAASEICDGIDSQASDVLAFEGYERSMAQYRRSGLDEQALQVAVERRCGRALSVISAAAQQALDDAATEEDQEAEHVFEPYEPEPEPAPEVDHVDLTLVNWLEQVWTTDCTSDGRSQTVSIVYEEEGSPARYRSGVGDSPVYEVEFWGPTFGDVTGNGHADAVFVARCVSNSSDDLLEVWSHDYGGQPVQLPPVARSTVSESAVEEVEFVDGRLRVQTFERVADASNVYDDTHPVSVVTEWAFDGAAWVAEEISRTETEASTVDVEHQCRDAGLDTEPTALCLLAAINAQDYARAATLTTEAVLDDLRQQRETWGPLNWEFDGCEGRSCWFYSPSDDPDYHGMVIEMWLETVGHRGWIVVIIEWLG